MTKLRWGILGNAGIARSSVIPAIQASKNGEVAAIASRGLERAQQTAKEMNIPKAYGSYEELLSDPEIDAVYIPLPNHLHKPWTIKAAEAGKHVLCEKPLALNAEEAQEMVEASKKYGIQLAEAFMYRHHPRYTRVKEIIASGEIGEIRSIHAAFTFNNPDDTGNVRFVKEMGGGSIYDVGCYPINGARTVLGMEPEAATVIAFFSEQHDDVDMMASGLLEFPNNIGVTFDCGMWAENRNLMQILGSKGKIDIPSPFVYIEDRMNFTVTVDGNTREEQVSTINHYIVQVEDFADSVLSNKPVRFPIEDAVANMKVIDACYESARKRERVKIQ